MAYQSNRPHRRNTNIWNSDATEALLKQELKPEPVLTNDSLQVPDVDIQMTPPQTDDIIMSAPAVNIPLTVDVSSSSSSVPSVVVVPEEETRDMNTVLSIVSTYNSCHSKKACSRRQISKTGEDLDAVRPDEYTLTSQFTKPVQRGAAELNNDIKKVEQFDEHADTQVRVSMYDQFNKEMPPDFAAKLTRFLTDLNEVTIQRTTSADRKCATLGLSIIDLLQSKDIDLGARMGLLNTAGKIDNLQTRYEMPAILRKFALIQQRVPDPDYGELECVTGQACVGIKYASKPFMQFVSPAVWFRLEKRHDDVIKSQQVPGSSTDQSNKPPYEDCYTQDPMHSGLCRLCILRLCTFLYRTKISAYILEQEVDDLPPDSNVPLPKIPADQARKYECELIQPHYNIVDQVGEYKSSACIPDNTIYGGLLRPILKYDENLWTPGFLSIESRHRKYAAACESNDVIYHGDNANVMVDF